jgi:hypothetical protein
MSEQNAVVAIYGAHLEAEEASKSFNVEKSTCTLCPSSGMCGPVEFGDAVKG